MAIQKFTVSRDDSIYEAWPDLCLTDSGRLICVFSECRHHGDRTDARLTLVTSDDRGRTWSEKRYLTEKGEKTAYWNCARIAKLADGRLAISCDFIRGHENGRNTQVWLWFSEDGGDTWSAPLATPLSGIVPDKLLETRTGRWILAAHTPSDDTGKLTEYCIVSDDQGKTWSERITVAADPRYNLCEASIIETSDSTLVCFLRENSADGIDCLKTFSKDGGLTWSEVYRTPIPGCHRPTAGCLADGTLMLTYRFMQGGKGWLGAWTQNFMAAFFTEESALASSRKEQTVRILPLDYDRSPVSDLGYSGWVQFDDGEIYAVEYIVDDAPNAQIRGYSFSMDDVLLKR
ncbi:MAG: exo-alpha-sialidase [Clostridia bacterium]|nr:exo-alpha-sialidase [Clostridia bacterium]